MLLFTAKIVSRISLTVEICVRVAVAGKREHFFDVYPISFSPGLPVWPTPLFRGRERRKKKKVETISFLYRHEFEGWPEDINRCPLSDVSGFHVYARICVCVYNIMCTVQVSASRRGGGRGGRGARVVRVAARLWRIFVFGGKSWAKRSVQFIVYIIHSPVYVHMYYIFTCMLVSDNHVLLWKFSRPRQRFFFGVVFTFVWGIQYV